MTFLEAQQYIASFINFEQRLPSYNLSSFKLERVQYLLGLLGDPQNQLKIIHVAGSKGKGSTCAMTASVLCKAGYKVGLYTSPHLNNYRERIRVLDGSSLRKGDDFVADEDIFPDMISEQELCAMLEAMQPHIERLQEEKTLGELSFFELFTALAFYYFRYKQVDCGPGNGYGRSAGCHQRGTLDGMRDYACQPRAYAIFGGYRRPDHRGKGCDH